MENGKVSERGGDMRKLGKEVAMEKSRRKGDIKVAKMKMLRCFPIMGMKFELTAVYWGLVMNVSVCVCADFAV